MHFWTDINFFSAPFFREGDRIVILNCNFSTEDQPLIAVFSLSTFTYPGYLFFQKTPVPFLFRAKKVFLPLVGCLLLLLLASNR